MTLNKNLWILPTDKPSKFWKESDERFKNKETLEEAVLRVKSENEHYIDEEAFELGAKWQQERSYSEEEVVSFIYKFIKEHQPQLPYLIGGINMWFEQFKKK